MLLREICSGLVRSQVSGSSDVEDTTNPVKIECPLMISGVGNDGCYLTDFTDIPVFQDCSPITPSQSGTPAMGSVITVTATDSSGNVGDSCEMTISQNASSGCKTSPTLVPTPFPTPFPTPQPSTFRVGLAQCV
jgi:hypothetical protein